YGCAGLTSVAIPANVTNIGENVFSHIPNLTAIAVIASNPAFSSVDGVLFNKSQTELLQYPIGKTEASYEIPQDVTMVSRDAFASCAALTGVMFPDSLTNIADWAFSDCSNLTNVVLPSGLTRLGDLSFLDCARLTNIALPRSLNSL